MNYNIKVPRFGQSLVEFTLVEIITAVNEHIKEGQEVVLLESDKSIHPVVAETQGVVHEIYKSVGERVIEGDLLLTLVRCERGDYENCDGRPKSESILRAESLVLREMRLEDIENCRKIWTEHQRLATGRRVPSTCEKVDFKNWLLANEHQPSIVCENVDQKVCGWGVIHRFEGSPLTRGQTGVVSVYVEDPESKASPAVLIMRHLLRSAMESRM
ncbi:MAG TPA: hypothetical protein DIW81_06420, partial [Planctomycetaceae bacterium]|nr:hypothetical protein [Planctomycetaceae bacterium]